jgi:hypothetical protein
MHEAPPLPTPSPSRSPARTLLAAAITLLVVAALLITLTHIYAPEPHTPNGAEQAATAFYAAVKQQDYTTAYTDLADDQQAKITQYSFTLFAQQQDATYGAVTAYHEVRYDRDTNHANEAEVQMRVQRANATSYTIVLTLVRTPDGAWKLLEEDRPI